MSEEHADQRSPDAGSKPPAPSACSTTATRIAAKETQVLAELSECVNALTSLQEILDDIVDLTKPVDDDDDDDEPDSSKQSNRSVTLRMHRLLKELQEWDEGELVA